MSREVALFDLRTEAEMRLYSDKTAKELAVKKQREEVGEEQAVADATVVAEQEQEQEQEQGA
ncbi:hypothetical protein [Streptomyces sp. SID13726]|uniref:hypothetical protein n=1 Tax=Streptomyces sp. SID13726 TaxID=2706058 RepID=UPI0013B6C689|nr:hypothetical protein [Streptomyces sp. SID13726]NEA98703.1 hypothetical protein [Streptomyces sp. SID13726]